MSVDANIGKRYLKVGFVRSSCEFAHHRILRLQPMSGPKGRTAALRDPPGGRLWADRVAQHKWR
jgi:hypothetical protein